MKLSDAEIRAAVTTALTEDVGSGDVTSLATVPANATFSVVMRAREPLVVAGIAFAETAFRSLSRSVHIKRLARDGQRVKTGAGLLQISGSARAILSALDRAGSVRPGWYLVVASPEASTATFTELQHHLTRLVAGVHA